MRSRKGFELSINMLVVIIIGIVIFGVGFYLITNLVEKADTQIHKVDDQLMEQMRRSQFDDGRRVAILNPKEAVQKKNQAYFLLGFVNKDNTAPPNNFSIVVKYSTKSPVNSDFSSSGLYNNKDNLIMRADGPFTLKYNEENFQWLAFYADKELPSGDYYFDVTVCYNGRSGTKGDCTGSDTQYGSKQRLFITVK